MGNGIDNDWIEFRCKWMCKFLMWEDEIWNHASEEEDM